MPGASSAEGAQLLRKALSLLIRSQPLLRGARLHGQADALVAELELSSGETRKLRIAPRSDAPAWTHSPSFSFSILPPAPSPLPRAESDLLRAFVELVRRRDPGGLPLASPTPAPQASSPAQAPTEELHRASFIAWKALTTEDLYPHVTPLGDLIDTAQLLDGWRHTLQLIEEGRAPARLGLYVHIPYCTVACSFCYCAKTDQFNRAGFERYVDRLVEEIALFAPAFNRAAFNRAGSSRARFTSVYFGGGTPSLLPAPAMRRIFQALYGAFDVPEGTQVIFEGNPDSLTEAKIEVLARQGRVSRLTIGVQTMDEEVQRRVRRFNKPEQVATAVRAARAMGITHVNTDLMAGLSGQSLASFQQDLDFLLALEPDSIHLNSYRPLPRVRLQQEEQDRMGPERVALREEMMLWASARLAQAGHKAHDGDRTRRTANAANLQEYDLRRENSSLLGLGFPSRAHAFGSWYYSPDTRSGMLGGLQEWLDGQPRWQAIPTDLVEERHKYLAENLRTGFTRAEFVELFGVDCMEVAGPALERLQQYGAVRIDAQRITATPKSAADNAIYRVLLYSPAFAARAWAQWGAEYEAGTDYRERMRELVEESE